MGTLSPMLREQQSAYLPNFLGIGAARSATTWLSSNLADHPEICARCHEVVAAS